MDPVAEMVCDSRLGQSWWVVLDFGSLLEITHFNVGRKPVTCHTTNLVFQFATAGILLSNTPRRNATTQKAWFSISDAPV
jgi:hypothetical protein